jgi:aryl-alcohol dehydrogenase-like predicted oxidoreductase
MASVVGLGTNNLGMKLDMQESRGVVHAALDAGITLFDTADCYGASEERLGGLLKGRRDDVVIATKFGSGVLDRGLDNGKDWGTRASRRYIRRAVESSLRRLKTDWIDLYQLHRPDGGTPIEETLSALDDLVHAGKVCYLGHSNLTGWQVADAEWTARDHGYQRFVSAQNEYSLLNRAIEADLVPALRHYGIGLLPFFPLANGILSGKYRRSQPVPAGSRLQVWGQEGRLTDGVFDLVDRLSGFADKRGVTLLDVAVGGLAAQPTVASVIAGATTAEQVLANVGAACWSPSAEDLAQLDAITTQGR